MYSTMKNLLLTFLFSFVVLPIFATTIVVYYNGQQVILAADSKLTTANITIDTANSTGSKIYKTGNSYFAVAGYIPVTFDVHVLIDSSIKSNSNIATSVALLKSTILTRLQADLKQQQQHKPQFFKANQPDYSNSILSLAIVGKVGDTPYFYILNFTLKDEVNVGISVQEINANINKAEQVYILGQNKAANQYFLSHQVVTNPMQYVNDLIRVQIAATPKTVGLPIRLIQVLPSDVKNYTIN